MTFIKKAAAIALLVVAIGSAAHAYPMGAPVLPFNFDPSGLKENLSLQADIIVTGPEMPISPALKIFAKPGKTRLEGIRDGKKFVSIIDAKQKVTYIFNPDDQTWVKWALPEKSHVSDTTGKPGITFTPPAGYVKGDRETIDGKECQTWSMANPDTKESGKVWIWTKNNILIQARSTGSQGTSSFLLKNLQLKAQPDSLFAPPAGTAVTDMSEMMKMFEQAKEKVNPYPDRTPPNPNGYGTPTY